MQARTIKVKNQSTGQFEHITALVGPPGADNVFDVEISAPASNWSANAPYTQTVSNALILASDKPIVDVILSDVLATRVLQKKAYGCISMMVTHNGGVTITCDTSKPVTDLTLNVKVAR